MRGRELKDRPYFCECGFQEGLLRVKVLVVGKRDIILFQALITLDGHQISMFVSHVSPMPALYVALAPSCHSDGSH